MQNWDLKRFDIGFSQQNRKNVQKKDMSFRAERSGAEESSHLVYECGQIGAKILRLASLAQDGNRFCGHCAVYADESR